MNNIEKRIEQEQETAEIPDILRTHLGESEGRGEEFGAVAPEDRSWAEKEMDKRMASPEMARRYPDVETRRKAVSEEIRGEAGYRPGKPGWFEEN